MEGHGLSKAAPIERIRIDAIQIGERRRERLGAIAELAKKIEEHGLLHPIIVTDERLLVCGARRLEACKRLGWKSIPARRWGDLSWEELRQIELDENVYREDLSSYEQSKQMLSAMEAEDADFSDNLSEKSRGKGRPRKHGPGTENERDLRAARKRRAKRHVDAAEAYPFLQRRGWTQSDVLDCRDRLDRIAQRDRESLTELLAEPGVPPKTARTIVHVASDMPAERRKDTLDLYRSGEKSKVEVAKARLSQLPPPPPPRLTWLRDSIRLVEKTLDDNLRIAQGELRSALGSLKAALKESEQSYQASRKEEGF